MKQVPETWKTIIVEYGKDINQIYEHYKCHGISISIDEVQEEIIKSKLTKYNTRRSVEIVKIGIYNPPYQLQIESPNHLDIFKRYTEIYSLKLMDIETCLTLGLIHLRNQFDDRNGIYHLAISPINIDNRQFHFTQSDHYKADSNDLREIRMSTYPVDRIYDLALLFPYYFFEKAV